MKDTFDLGLLKHWFFEVHASSSKLAGHKVTIVILVILGEVLSE